MRNSYLVVNSDWQPKTGAVANNSEPKSPITPTTVTSGPGVEDRTAGVTLVERNGLGDGRGQRGGVDGMFNPSQTRIPRRGFTAHCRPIVF